MAYLAVRLLTTACVLYLVHSYQSFRENIPNGLKVPNPCNTDEIWLGVGHEALSGGGKRNPFGLDFKAQGYTWTEELCRMDSDGDGKYNGEELGDPNCVWKKDAIPERTSEISHPGVCEPIGSEKCQGDLAFLKECSAMDFKCDAIADDNQVFTVDVSLTKSAVPAQETTYKCQAVDLKDVGVSMDNDYHLVATKGYIDTVEVMHHVIAYGCKDNAKIPDDLWSPTTCFMSTVEGCEEIIGIWTIGTKGFCYQKDAGFRIGKTGFKKVVLELHWNNEEVKSTFSDGSGLTFFLTPNLRDNDAGMFLIGQTQLSIPPYTKRHTEEGTCSSECTQELMKDDIKIVGALNHMHTLGSAITSSMIPNDGKDTVIISHEESYDYNSPKFVVFEEPLHMEPGYSLNIKCHYDSSSRNYVTEYGEGTSEEMCFTFLMYYPKENWEPGENCISTGDYDECSGCDFKALVNLTHPDTVRRNTLLYENCVPGFCKEGCLDVVREIFKEPCFQEDNFNIIKSGMNNEDPQRRLEAMDYFYRIDSCNAELAREKCEKGWTTHYPPPVGGATSTKIASSAFIFILTTLISLM